MLVLDCLQDSAAWKSISRRSAHTAEFSKSSSKRHSDAMVCLYIVRCISWEKFEYSDGTIVFAKNAGLALTEGMVAAESLSRPQKLLQKMESTILIGIFTKAIKNAP